LEESLRIWVETVCEDPSSHATAYQEKVVRILVLTLENMIYRRVKNPAALK
jgi:hypothetical protein